jgi:hypothetical protein
MVRSAWFAHPVQKEHRMSGSDSKNPEIKPEAKPTEPSVAPKSDEISDDKMKQVVGGMTTGVGTSTTDGGCVSQL